MARLYYSEYAIENIARRVLTAYDSRLYYGAPAAVPIEALIEANGLSLDRISRIHCDHIIPVFHQLGAVRRKG